MQRSRIALILPCLVLGACDYRDFDPSDRYQSDFHYSYPLNPGGRLEVDSFNGEIEIAGWDENRCDISGVKYASTAEIRDRIKIEVNPSANGIFVRSERPIEDFHGNTGVRYVIHVPRKTALSRITTSNGSIHIEDVEGPADLKTRNGPVRVESLKGTLTAHTTNGSITAEQVVGAMDLRTSNGPIRAEHVMAAVEANTSNGSITVNFDDRTPVSPAPLKLETDNGSVDVTIPTPPKSDIRARTRNHGITLRLPENTTANLRAETSHGEVHSDFGPQTESDRHSRQRVREETIGGGGPLIDLHTTNGSIRLLRM